MIDPYDPCPCGSGKKAKFCCSLALKQIKHSPAALTDVTKYPLSRCLIRNEWKQDGLAVILLARKLPNLNFVCATYSVDTYCLGLKDTFIKIDINEDAIESIQDRLHCEWRKCDYEMARSVILGGIEYAENLGFSPNIDWKNTKYLIEPERPSNKIIEFGKDGQPFYVQGPNDNPEKILAQLKQKTGDHFHYMLRFG
jgi:hypothetical protein